MDNRHPPSPPDDLKPLRTQQDLEDLWRMLMGDLGFVQPQLWLAVLDAEHRATGILTKIEQLPALPEATTTRNLIGVCDSLLEEQFPGGSVAFLYCRPGPGPIIARDLAWGRGLLTAARQADVPCRPVHFACDDVLQVMSLDDLGLPESA